MTPAGRHTTRVRHGGGPPGAEGPGGEAGPASTEGAADMTMWVRALDRRASRPDAIEALARRGDPRGVPAVVAILERLAWANCVPVGRAVAALTP